MISFILFSGKKAEQNKKLKEELEIFARDLGNVSSVAFEIFDKYDKRSFRGGRGVGF